MVWLLIKLIMILDCMKREDGSFGVLYVFIRDINKLSI